MRTKNSLKNLLVSITLGIVVIVVNFVTQRFFVDTLGTETLGLNSLFTNLITMLSIAELGFGSAIIFHLYKPLHKKDIAKTSSLLRFYRTSYRIIAAVVLVIALIILPFLPKLAGAGSVSGNIYIIYGLFVANAIFSYLMSYKWSILYADQKNYIINAVRLSTLIASSVLKIIFLVATKDYYIFLLVTITGTVAENIILNRIVDRKYRLIANPQPVDVKTKQSIFTQIKGLLFHKIGTFVIFGTDSIIISINLGLHTLGLFSNYQVIITAIQSLFGQISNAIRASIGNLLVDVGNKKSFTTFLRLQFANQILAVVSVSVFFVASDRLIAIWLGDRYILETTVVAVLSLSLYFNLVRAVFNNFKEAAGIFYEDRFVPLVESAINLIASLILVQFIGLAGVFIGTVLSSLALHCYSYPKYVYKGIFGRSYREYIFMIVKDFIIALTAIACAYYASRLIVLDAALAQLACDVIIAITIPTALLWLLHRNTQEYAYFKGLLARLLHKIGKSRA